MEPLEQIARTGRAARALAGLAALVAIALCLSVPPVATAAPEAEPGLKGMVNVNTATLEELQLLPGIGASRAQAVIDARKQRGGFERVDDLLEVKGIGEVSLERMRPYVTTTGKTTARLE